MERPAGKLVASRSTCARCADLIASHFDRRRFLHVAAGGFAAVAFAPWNVLAAGAQYGNYDAMLLTCIDPRFQEPVSKYTAERRLTGKYSQFTIAGASVGVVAPAFETWHETFWDNLGASIGLHGIDQVIAINHRDCGAAEIAYGEDAVADRAAETKTHREALAAFRRQLAERHPQMGAETLLMALDGTVEDLS
jgi:hypothetical protein